MATLDSIPAQQTLTASYSRSQASGGMGKIKLIPKNLDGTVMDMTGFTGASIILPLATPIAPTTVQSNSLTIDVADATGLSVSLTQSQLTTVLNNMINLPASNPYSITAVNGTPDTVLVASGTFVVNITT